MLQKTAFCMTSNIKQDSPIRSNIIANDQQNPSDQTSKKRKSKRKQGSRGFVIGSRSKLPRTRATTAGNTTNIVKLDGSTNNTEQKKKKSFDPFTFFGKQMISLIEYKSLFDDCFSNNRNSLNQLLFIEIYKHVHDMENFSFFPFFKSNSLRHESNSSLSIIQKSDDTPAIIEYVNASDCVYPVLEISFFFVFFLVLYFYYYFIFP